MSNPTTGASPQSDATNSSGGKVADGNNPVGEAKGDLTQNQPTDLTALQSEIATLKQNYADSSRQAQQQRYLMEDEARKRKEAEERLAAYTTPAAPTTTTAGANLKKAMYAEDEAGIDAALQQVTKDATAQARTAATEEFAKKEQKQQNG